MKNMLISGLLAVGAGLCAEPAQKSARIVFDFSRIIQAIQKGEMTATEVQDQLIPQLTDAQLEAFKQEVDNTRDANLNSNRIKTKTIGTGVCASFVTGLACLFKTLQYDCIRTNASCITSPEIALAQTQIAAGCEKTWALGLGATALTLVGLGYLAHLIERSTRRANMPLFDISRMLENEQRQRSQMAYATPNHNPCNND